MEPDTDSFPALMAAATKFHKQNDNAHALENYEKALLLNESDPELCILLASLLLVYPPGASDAQLLRSKELAERALRGVASLPDDYARATLYARFGHYMMTRANASGDDAEPADHATIDAARERALEAAISALNTAISLAPSVVIAWKNLSTAYRLLKRFKDAEQAMANAVTYSRAKNPTLLYGHAMALKRVEAWDACVQRFCDVVTLKKRDDLSVYWIRVMASAHRDVLETTTLTRIHNTLSEHGYEALDKNVVVPHEYVKKLFDGYAKTFEEHLTSVLQYKTPHALLQMALQAVKADATGTKPRWLHCADLGCGTGLAGAEFRPYVDRLSGVDLSAGMVEEARKRGLYDNLAVGAIETWLQEQNKAGVAAKCDLVVAADVLVYISSLEEVFSGVSLLMCASSTAPLFIFSTEADTSVAAADDLAHVTDATSVTGPFLPDGDGFRLTATGRCVHQRRYVLQLAERYGFTALLIKRQPIRKNNGADVIGDLYVLQRSLAATP